MRDKESFKKRVKLGEGSNVGIVTEVDEDEDEGGIVSDADDSGADDDDATDVVDDTGLDANALIRNSSE